MNNLMFDIRVLGNSDSPIFAIECVFFEPSTGKIGPRSTARLISHRRRYRSSSGDRAHERDSAQRAEVINATTR
jgi:hypothetical protein